ncbi:hypothetical protein D3C75_1181290 [compost metagenome]
MIITQSNEDVPVLNSESVSISQDTKPITAWELISRIITVVSFLIVIHTKLQPNPIPDKYDTLIDIQTQQLQVQQKQYDETIRHNKVTEDNDEAFKELLSKMVYMMDTISSEE